MPQHPEQTQASQWGRAGRLVVGLAVVSLATACSGGGEKEAAGTIKPSEVSAAPAAGVVAPAKVEVIANLTGCKPKIRIEADELRQGLCHTKEVDYLITTFPAEEYKQSWLDAASVYGGKYLVGSRWIVSAKEPEMLERFQDKLGGTVQQLRGMGPSAAPSGS
ncbi:hypothetical protein ACIP8U_41210 [Streptomyces pseudovenezuelae]|uniref:hypothetical protein n=1 Tax=Streptomyces pseudovenezuelae TaxID=67350 RepID=UPI0036EFED4E